MPHRLRLLKSLLVLLLCGLFLPSTVEAQNVDDRTSARNLPPVRFTIGSVYQQWEYEGVSLHEFSAPLSLQLQASPNLGFSLGINQAIAGGDGLEQVNGLTDVQLNADYLVRLDKHRVIFNVGATLPTGKSRFSEREFETVSRLHLSQYNFRVPYFGQGASIAPGVALIATLSRSVVASLGATYRYRNAFEPISDLVQTYDWGNELLFTIGGEAQIGKTVSVALDAIYTQYDSDKIGDAVVYEAGRRLMAIVRLDKSFHEKKISLIARYRDSDSNRVFDSGALRPEVLSAFPGLYQFSTHYRFRPGPRVDAGFLLRGTWFEADFAFDKLSIFDLGSTWNVAISPVVTLSIQATYSFGDLSGFDAGMGINVIL